MFLKALREAFWVLPVALMGTWAVAWLTLYVDTPPDPFLDGLKRAGIATPVAIVVWAVGALSMLSGDRKEIRELKKALANERKKSEVERRDFFQQMLASLQTLTSNRRRHSGR